MKASAANGACSEGSDRHPNPVGPVGDERRHILRGRQIVDHRIEQRLDPLVLESGPVEDRHGPTRDRRPAQSGPELRLGDLEALDEQSQELLVHLRHQLDHLLPGRPGLDHLFRRDLGLEKHRSGQIAHPFQAAHTDQVDHPLKIVLQADRQLNRNGMGAQASPDLLDTSGRVRPHPITLVDESQPRNPILIGLAPHRLGLRLHPAHGTEQRHRSVQNAQAALDLDGEVDVTGRIDDVDPVVTPEAGGRSRGDGDSPLLLLLHPIHDRGAIVHFAHAVGDAGVIEDALGGRGLARIDMRHDPDVSGFIDCDLPNHDHDDSLGAHTGALEEHPREVRRPRC